MQIFFVASMCVINLVLWLVFFVKFKKLFTTENEIQKTREQYELLIADINRNTLSNINLIDSKIEELKEILAIAERQVFILQNDKNVVNQNFKQKSNVRSTNIQSASKFKNSSKSENVATRVINQDDAFEIKINRKTRKKQADLFDSVEEKPVKDSIHYVDSRGNGYGEVPIMSSKVYMDDIPQEKQLSLSEQVQKFINLGYDVEKIASALNKSITEIQLVIEML